MVLFVAEIGRELTELESRLLSRRRTRKMEATLVVNRKGGNDEQVVFIAPVSRGAAAALHGGPQRPPLSIIHSNHSRSSKPMQRATIVENLPTNWLM
mmetsp:Transcript_3997/g.7177  ORF Transcript_3997/g.7177 Transcript_3997/m.7177 type:complete len:97 (-) Transcript_3997:230-520(-)